MSPNTCCPRLHGFELMMAPYTIAHLKLDMEIAVSAQERLKVYLTNSLEEYNPNANTLFGNALSQEANAASHIKKEAPIMVMIGNPPYSGESKNKGKWIMDLMEDYKKEPGGHMPLQERNSKWINDDYCKFIRLGQYYVDRNNEGILAYICGNGFLDNPTFRGMRWHLLQSFDKIYVLNLHGNSKKKETTPDGSKDENVFDIMTGVSINIFIKTGKKKKGELAEVYYSDLMGVRKDKYDFLDNHVFHSTNWKNIQLTEPFYFFVPKNTNREKEYNKFFSIVDLMKINSVGIVTARDAFSIASSEDIIRQRITTFLSKTDEEDRIYFNLGKDARDWSIAMAKNDLLHSAGAYTKIAYRPFDEQYTYYTGNSKGFHCMPRGNVMKHLLSKEDNIALLTCRQLAGNDWCHVSVADCIVDDCRVSNKTRERGYVFPLYLYPEAGSLETERRANLDEKIWSEISRCACKDTTPEEVFDYIYGVLHSPKYREQYREFLKVDFPRVPYPESPAAFQHFAAYGHRLRELHLMHDVPMEVRSPNLAPPPSPLPASGAGECTCALGHFTAGETPASPVNACAPGQGILDTTFPIEGDCLVEQVRWENDRVYINGTQYFDHVPQTAWSFYIGGYQPAQKWLKDRKGRTLSFDDLTHYARIIHILLETDRLMQEIDNTTF